MSNFTDNIKAVPGLTHYYPLTTDARDVVGAQHGVSTGVSFVNGKAIFNGAGSINLGDSPDFSVATKQAMTILVFLTVDDWTGAGASEYVHWAGKGKANAHEWTFRHYVRGGTGEAATRQGRTSFYHFNPAGGLGSGSYYQDPTYPVRERMIVATANMSQIALYVEGQLRDVDLLSDYAIVPKDTASPVMLGTRGDATGSLIGKIRRVAFFDRLLTAAEIYSIYNDRLLPEVEPVVVAPPPPVVVTPPVVVVNEFAATSDIVAKHNALVKVLREKGLI